MKLLALETSTEALSVALMVDESVESFHEVAPRRHGELLLPAVDRLLADAGLELTDLDAIAFGRGPGAFTGVRIAIAAAQGLAFAAGLPLVPVSSLAGLAQSVHEDTGAARVLAAFDARMGEVYAGWFEFSGGLAEPARAEWLGTAEALPQVQGEWTRTGTGFGVEAYPHAAAIARLGAAAFAAGAAVPPERAQPVYLRDRVTVS